MTDQEINPPSPDERILAALAHITILVPFMGVIAPIVIWVTQKDKSRYVGFQALQAVVFQLLLVLAWFIGMGCYMASFFTVFIGMFASSGPSSQTTGGPGQILEPLLVVIPFIVFGLVIIAGIAFVIYGFIAALQVLRGKAFRYVVIGNQVERFLQQPKPAQEQSVENVP